jgi:hypothetical protein
MMSPPTTVAASIPNNPLARIWDSGVLAHLTISLGRTQVPLEREEVGADERAEKDIVRLGHKALFSKEMFKPIQNAISHARGDFARYTLPFPVGSARFVPLKAYPILLKELEAARNEFDAAVATFLENFEANKEQMLAENPGILQASDYPPVADMEFSMGWTAFTLNPAGEEANKKIQSAVDSFVKETVGTLRSKVMDACAEKSALLAKGGKVTEKTLRSLREMVEQLNSLNFVQDDVTEHALAQLSAQLKLRTAEEIRENDVAKADFARVLDLVTASVKDTSDATEVADAYMGRVIDTETE